MKQIRVWLNSHQLGIITAIDTINYIALIRYMLDIN